MSVFHCEGCEKNIDSDFIECHDVDDGLICDDCFMKEVDILMMIAEYEHTKKLEGVYRI